MGEQVGWSSSSEVARQISIAYSGRTREAKDGTWRNSRLYY